MQHKHTKIEAHQFTVSHDLHQRYARGTDHGSIGNDEYHHRNGGQREHTGQDENATHTDPAIEQGGQYHRCGKSQTDAGPYHCHRLGAMLLARSVCNERGNGGGNSACTLHCTTDHDPEHAISAGGDQGT